MEHLGFDQRLSRSQMSTRVFLLLLTATSVRRRLSRIHLCWISFAFFCPHQYDQFVNRPEITNTAQQCDDSFT